MKALNCYLKKQNRYVEKRAFEALMAQGIPDKEFNHLFNVDLKRSVSSVDGGNDTWYSREQLEELLAENGPVGSLRRHFAESSSATLANLEFHDRIERIHKLLAPLLASFEEFCKKESEEKRDFFSSALRQQIKICELAAKIFKELQVKKSELVELSAIFADEVDILFSATCSLSAHASNSKIGTHLRKLLVIILKTRKTN